MSEIAKTIGRRVRNYRIEKGLSQEKLAELSGCHPTYIGQVERGEKNATLESIEKIASAMNVSLAQLFEKTQRQKEYYSFLKVWTPLQKWFRIRRTAFRERKTYKYFKCPNCRQQLRAPRGRGKILVTCQRCHKQFNQKT